MTGSGHIKFTFLKEERLTGKKNIEELFQHGSSFYLHPLLLKYTSKSDDLTCNRILISVPKKKFKRAVHRNLLKRRIKEAYRLNKNQVFQGDPPYYHFAIIYLDKVILPYAQIEEKLIHLLKRLKNLTNEEKI
ncbi:MAG: ribonuclease P protein component [Cyclobacteriaceae bacterium]|jgi:ribonuclease P protein component